MDSVDELFDPSATLLNTDKTTTPVTGNFSKTALKYKLNQKMKAGLASKKRD